MLTWDNSSIDDVTNTLERVKRQRILIRILHTNKSAAEVVVCVQNLKQSVDGFLVGDLVIAS